MYIWAEIVKFFGAALGTTVAIAATYLDGTRSAESGRLTRKGRLLVSSAILSLLLSGGVQLLQLLNAQASAEATRLRNEETADRLERIPFLLARDNYPLEPIELLYTIEYSMDSPQLKPYVDRLSAQVAAYLNKKRGSSDTTTEHLSNENQIEVTDTPEWRPVKAENSANTLVADVSTFRFNGASDSHRCEAEFISMPPEFSGLLVKMKEYGEPSQRIDLLADFKRRLFVKHVISRNPARTGEDVGAVSTLDLIGCQIAWELSWPELNPRLAAFAMRFSYDYGFGQNFGFAMGSNKLAKDRAMVVRGLDRSIITPVHVGMSEVLTQLSSESTAAK